MERGSRAGAEAGLPTPWAIPAPSCTHARLFAHPLAPPSFPQGVDGGDVDLPTVFEASVVSSTVAKFFYGLCYLLFYAVRPLVVRPKSACELPEGWAAGSLGAECRGSCSSGRWPPLSPRPLALAVLLC